MSRRSGSKPIGATPEVHPNIQAESDRRTAPEPEERMRQSAAPICPNCKDDAGKPHIVCKAQKTHFHATIYVCPQGCGFRIPVPRPIAADKVAEAERREQQGQGVQRPKV